MQVAEQPKLEKCAKCGEPMLWQITVTKIVHRYWVEEDTFHAITGWYDLDEGANEYEYDPNDNVDFTLTCPECEVYVEQSREKE